MNLSFPAQADLAADHAYVVELAPRPAAAASRPAGSWVVVGGGAVGAALAEALGGVLVAVGGGGDPEATLAAVEAAVTAAMAPDCAGVACLAALDGGLDHPGGAVEANERTVLAACAAALGVARAAAARSGVVVVATRGALPGDLYHAAAAPGAAVWGLARTFACEFAGAVRCVDLCPDETSAAEDAAAVALEVAAGPGESAWRRRRRCGPALARLAVATDADAGALAGDHVVTGGAGGLGRAWAAHVARAAGAAASLVLAGRRRPDRDLLDFAASLANETGAAVAAASGDCASRADAARLARPHVWHLAGVVGSASVAAVAWRDFDDVCRPKVAGSLCLDAASRAGPSATFVMFSSVYGVLASRDLCHYAAANAFQDGFARCRRAAGAPATAVAWGTWAGAGMARRRVEINRWNALAGKNFKPLHLDHIAIDLADFWANRVLSSSSRSTAKELASKPSHTRPLKSG